MAVCILVDLCVVKLWPKSESVVDVTINRRAEKEGLREVGRANKKTRKTKQKEETPRHKSRT